MNSTAKVIVPNKEWLIQNDDKKIGSISKSKKGYTFLRGGKRVPLADISEISSKYGITLADSNFRRSKIEQTEKGFTIYDFPCSSKPYEPIYNVKKKLPLYAKSSKSKSQYCAGYYVIKFRKGWVKSFCPKLITLERYPYYGPFKTEAEMKSTLNNVNKS
jgi:hypothetical protein